MHSSAAVQAKPFNDDPEWHKPVDDSRMSSWERSLGAQQHTFPDWVEEWNRDRFYQLGAVGAAAVPASFAAFGPAAATPYVLGAVVGGYWYLGIQNINSKHAVSRNFPVLGMMRYFLESVRPEIRQYFIESDTDANPYHRQHRSTIYRRAKGLNDTLPFGTRHDVYSTGYQWVKHSMFPKVVPEENKRILIGGNNPDVKQPYSASIMNVSGMSYGALSDNAVLALNHLQKGLENPSRHAVCSRGRPEPPRARRQLPSTFRLNQPIVLPCPPLMTQHPPPCGSAPCTVSRIPIPIDGGTTVGH